MTATALHVQFQRSSQIGQRLFEMLLILERKSFRRFRFDLERGHSSVSCISFILLSIASQNTFLFLRLRSRPCFKVSVSLSQISREKFHSLWIFVFAMYHKAVDYSVFNFNKMTRIPFVMHEKIYTLINTYLLIYFFY